jgi:aspartate ammonia-lyase
MPEMLTMVCFQVLGNDEAISMAAQAGQLELNVMFPIIAKNILESLTWLTNAIGATTSKCINGITANKHVCALYAEHSAGIATLLNPYIGYDKAAFVVQESLRTGLSIPAVVVKHKLMTPAQVKKVLK